MLPWAVPFRRWILVRRGPSYTSPQVCYGPCMRADLSGKTAGIPRRSLFLLTAWFLSVIGALSAVGRMVWL